MAKSKKKERVEYRIMLHRKGAVVTKCVDYSEDNLVDVYDGIAADAIVDFIKGEIDAVGECTHFTITAR